MTIRRYGLSYMSLRGVFGEQDQSLREEFELARYEPSLLIVKLQLLKIARTIGNKTGHRGR